MLCFILPDFIPRLVILKTSNNEIRLVRATVNLHRLRAGNWTWIDWPPTDYIARMLRAQYLVLVDYYPEEATVSLIPPEPEAGPAPDEVEELGNDTETPLPPAPPELRDDDDD